MQAQLFITSESFCGFSSAERILIVYIVYVYTRVQGAILVCFSTLVGRFGVFSGSASLLLLTLTLAGVVWLALLSSPVLLEWYDRVSISFIVYVLCSPHTFPVRAHHFLWVSKLPSTHGIGAYDKNILFCCNSMLQRKI